MPSLDNGGDCDNDKVDNGCDVVTAMMTIINNHGDKKQW